MFYLWVSRLIFCLPQVLFILQQLLKYWGSLVRAHALGKCVGFLNAYLKEDRCPLPLNLLNELVQVHSFRLIRHLQQTASFCSPLYCSCHGFLYLSVLSLHHLWRLPLNSPRYSCNHLNRLFMWTPPFDSLYILDSR